MRGYENAETIAPRVAMSVADRQFKRRVRAGSWLHRPNDKSWASLQPTLKGICRTCKRRRYRYVGRFEEVKPSGPSELAASC